MLSLAENAKFNNISQ